MEEEFLDYMRESHNKALPFEEMVKAELDRLELTCSGLRWRIEVLQEENVRLDGIIKDILELIRQFEKE